MPVNFAAKWKELKIDYEAATDREKPSEKFLGVFRKKSGLEAAFTTLDAALKKEDVDGAKKAFETVEKAADLYQKVLFKAVSSEKNKGIQDDTKILMKKLNDLIEDAEITRKITGQITDIKNLRDFTKLMRSPAADRVSAFARKVYSEEILSFLVAMSSKDHSGKVYKAFIKNNDVNIEASLQKKFKEDELQDAPWEEATKEVLGIFNNNVIHGLNKQTRGG